MSVKLMSAVWEQRELKGGALLLMLALADYANDEGTQIRPSISTLANKVRLSTGQTRRLLYRLTAAGYLFVETRPGRPNLYRINLAALTPRTEDTPRVCDHPTPRVDARTRIKGARVDDQGKEPTPRASDHPTPRMDARTPRAPVQADPLLIHHDDPPDSETDANASAAAPLRLTLTEQFRVFHQELQQSQNRAAVLRRAYVYCYGEADPPTYSRLGKVAVAVGGAGRLLDLLWQHSSRPPNGDVLSYIERAHRAQAAERGNRRYRPKLNEPCTDDEAQRRRYLVALNEAAGAPGAPARPAGHEPVDNHQPGHLSQSGRKVPSAEDPGEERQVQRVLSQIANIDLRDAQIRLVDRTVTIALPGTRVQYAERQYRRAILSALRSAGLPFDLEFVAVS